MLKLISFWVGFIIIVRGVRVCVEVIININIRFGVSIEVRVRRIIRVKFNVQ